MESGIGAIVRLMGVGGGGVSVVVVVVVVGLGVSLEAGLCVSLEVGC